MRESLARVREAKAFRLELAEKLDATGRPKGELVVFCGPSPDGDEILEGLEESIRGCIVVWLEQKISDIHGRLDTKR
jgi:hypothetical protein